MLRIAIAQINSAVGNLQGNADKIACFIMQANKHDADIVVFPELALCGYPPEDLLLKNHFIDDNQNVLDSLIEKVYGITAIVGFVDTDMEGNLYNAAGIIHNRILKGVYRKTELPNYSVFDEKRYFTPGRGNYVFTLGKLTFGVNICEDIWKADGSYKEQVNAGAEMLINISASPYHTGKRKEREKLLINRARETGAFVCYVNLVGGQDELVFDGASLLFNPEGKLIACARQFEEDLVIAELDTSSVSKNPSSAQGTSTCTDIRITSGSRHASRTPMVKKPLHIPKKIGRLEEIYNALVLGVRDYIEKNNFQKAVIGLSGGIDSSLTAVIAYDALGKENVIGVSMPSQYSSEETQSDSRVLAGNLKIKFTTVPINSIFDMYLTILKKEFSDLNRDVTEENLQARIRGNILMAFSNKFGWLVLTTGNKSEASVGYCTLYGDMAGGIAVIKDVPKTLVYRLAKFRNDKGDKQLIPNSVLTREPSAELRTGQKDEDTLPPYSVLDRILESYVEKDRSFENIAEEFNPGLVKDIIRMVDRNEYKRRQSPPGIKITPKAFGRDRRFPITNKYKGF